MTYFLIIISAIFVNNIVLAQFLGICPFLGVSKRISTGIGMTGAVTFVMVIATIVTWFIQNYILIPFYVTYLQTITFILLFTTMVLIDYIVITKENTQYYQYIGDYIPLKN